MQVQLLLLSTQSDWPCENDAPEPVSQVLAQPAQLEPLLVPTFCFCWMLKAPTIEQFFHLQPPQRISRAPMKKCSGVC